MGGMMCCIAWCPAYIASIGCVLYVVCELCCHVDEGKSDIGEVVLNH